MDELSLLSQLNPFHELLPHLVILFQMLVPTITLTSKTRDVFLEDGEGGDEDDLMGGGGGARWPPMPAELLDIVVAFWRFITSMNDTDLPRFRGGGGRRCSKEMRNTVIVSYSGV